MTDIGRNDPCPCGSGKKYKKCCLIKESNLSFGDDSAPTSSVIPGLREALEGQKFNSLEEAQNFTSSYTQSRNTRPIEEFHDISPEQMVRFLYHPFESQEIIHFSQPVIKPSSVPLIQLIQLLFNGIGEMGIKATAKGNLPRNLCREIALTYWGETDYKNIVGYRRINTEIDFFDLHVARQTAKLAGLIRKYKGKFLLTKKGQVLMVEEKLAELYFLLFKTYTLKFNWGYWDGYEEMQIIQNSFAFTLYLLSRYGSEWQSPQVYSDYALKAFPAVLNEIDDRTWSTPEDSFKSCYTIRSVERFALFLGLVEMDQKSEKKTLKKDYQIRKTALLDELVHFNLRTVH